MSLDHVELVAAAIEDLNVVFVGGAVTPLYLSSDAVSRPTDDVDCVVTVSSRIAYNQLEGELRRRGLRQPIAEGGPICRWRLPVDAELSIVVGVMPSDPAILGFSNDWYELGAQAPVSRTLPSGRTVRVFRPSLFLASKVEAYEARGAKDPLFSHDLEDVITLLEGCKGLVDDVESSPAPVRGFLGAWSRDRLADPNFGELVDGNLGGRGAALLRRRAEVFARLKRLSSGHTPHRP